MNNFVSELMGIFGSDIVSVADDRHLNEPRGRYRADEMPLLRPRTTQEVSDIVKHCNQHTIQIVPFAGGTGLVGGQVMENAPNAIILSVERMTKLRGIWPEENVMVIEAGAILEDVQNHADGVDRLFPLSLASQGSCRIGGNLATNAGGVQVLRYGNARDLCLGLEAVLPDGSIYHGLRRLRKDNTGYDIRNLLIGSEGSLGIITAASLKMFAKPKNHATAMVVVRDVNGAIELLSQMQSELDGTISAFELLHKTSFEFLKETMPEIRLPFEQVPEWAVLIEATSAGQLDVTDRLLNSLEQPMADGLVLDAAVSQSMGQRDAFWNVRENIPTANRKIGAIASHDISIPISRIPEFIKQTPKLFEKIAQVRINCFGHLGDGNLHYNLFPIYGCTKGDYFEQREALSRVIHDQVHAFEGSISAEHGIGRLKADDLERYGDPAKLTAMRAIKSALDPNGIMNPGAVLKNV